MMARPITLLTAMVACAAAVGVARAQSQGEFELRNGKRIPAEFVKPAASGFTAQIPVADTYQTVNFTAAEVLNSTCPEPQEFFQARILTASGKPDEAIAILGKIQPALDPFKKVPGSWWTRSVILQMDALSAKGRGDEGAALATQAIQANLTPVHSAAITEFQTVVGRSTAGTAAKIEALKDIGKNTLDPWTAARVWLEIGNLEAGQGKIEDAVKAWFRAPVFHPAEQDIAVRGTILAARGLQQLDRPEDGLKTLKDFLDDNPITPYKDLIQMEIAKLQPQTKKGKSNDSPAPGDKPAPAEAK